MYFSLMICMLTFSASLPFACFLIEIDVSRPDQVNVFKVLRRIVVMPGPGVKEITHTVYTLHAVIGPVSSLQQSVYLLPVPCRQAAVPHRAPAQTETQTIICFCCRYISLLFSKRKRFLELPTLVPECENIKISKILKTDKML